MNCFYHPEIPALGVCKHCSKGVCGRCAIDNSNQGLSCSTACQQKLELSVNQAKVSPISLTIASGVLAFVGLSAALQFGLSVAFGQIMLVIGIAGLVLCAHHVRSLFEVRSTFKSRAGIPNNSTKVLPVQSDDLEEKFKSLEADQKNMSWVFEIKPLWSLRISIPSGEQLFLSSRHLASSVKLEHRLRWATWNGKVQ